MAITINGSGTVSGITAGLTAASMPAGSVIQVVQGTYKDGLTNDTASEAWWDCTQLTASIPPTDNNNKILIRGMVNLAVASPTQSIGIQINRGGTAISDALGTSTGSRTSVTTISEQTSAYTTSTINIEYLDSPATTNSTAYNFEFRHGSGSSRVIYLNKTINDTDEAEYMRSISTITLMEIAV